MEEYPRTRMSSTPSKMNKHQSRMNKRMTDAVLQVLQSGAWTDPPKQYESNRMKHDRIANQIADILRNSGLNAEAWATYGGDKKFGITLRCGPYTMFVEPN